MKHWQWPPGIPSEIQQPGIASKFTKELFPKFKILAFLGRQYNMVFTPSTLIALLVNLSYISGGGPFSLFLSDPGRPGPIYVSGCLNLSESLF